MDIKTTLNANELTIALIGRLDTVTAPELEKTLNTSLDGVKSLIFDFTDLEYVSSAGLRMLLRAQKTMNQQGTMVVRNANENIQEVFEITGFDDVLTIEK